MTTLSYCAYCNRKNVPAAPATSEASWGSRPVILFTSISMCADCAFIASMSLIGGLEAFAKAVELARQPRASEPPDWSRINKEVDLFLKSLDPGSQS